MRNRDRTISGLLLSPSMSLVASSEPAEGFDTAFALLGRGRLAKRPSTLAM